MRDNGLVCHNPWGCGSPKRSLDPITVNGFYIINQYGLHHLYQIFYKNLFFRRFQRDLYRRLRRDDLFFSVRKGSSSTFNKYCIITRDLNRYVYLRGYKGVVSNCLFYCQSILKWVIWHRNSGTLFVICISIPTWAIYSYPAYYKTHNLLSYLWKSCKKILRDSWYPHVKNHKSF